MKAVLAERDKMYLGDCSFPVRGPYDILIEVKAAGVNRADLLQRKGKYPPPKGASTILGLEVAGIVKEAGSKVSRWKEGDKVFGLLSGGGYAQYAVMSEEMAMPVPENFNFIQAAALPEVFLTAYQALIWLAKLQKGERVLIHAGASGVGTAAIQLAKESGAVVFATASAPKHALCRELGALQTIDYTTQNFAEEVLTATDGKGVDVVVDFIGGPYFTDNLKTLATDGRLVLLASLGGMKVPEANLLPVLLKRLSIFGSTLRSRSPEYQSRLTQEMANFILPCLKDGRIRPVVDSVFPVERAAEAHEYMEANKNQGKIVLDLS